MKTAKSRKISAVLACVLSLSIMAGCEKTAEGGGEIPSLDTAPATSAPETDIIEDTSVPEITTAAETTTVTETESETETTSETEESSETEETSETSETEETSETAEEREWSETEISGIMYVTENCYSREKAVIGSTPISQHYAGDTVEVVAITDTGYYKLAKGGFIHSDYISDKKPAETTVPTATTSAPESTTIGTTTTAPADTEPAETKGPDKPFGGSTGGEAIKNDSYNIKSSSRYAYKQLSSEEQELYDKIVEAVITTNSVVEIPSGMSSEQVVKVYTIVYDSEPQLFWMGNTVSAGSYFATLSFKTTDREEIKAMQSEINSAAADIISKASNYSGTVSKLKVFFDSIVQKAEFSKSDSGYNCSVYNGFTGKGALQCAGYAKTMQYLCDLAGIESCVVRGTDKDGSTHAWNVVYCENGYYNLDTTWGDPINSYGSSYIQYEFFLVPDAWIHNKTHCNVSTLIRGNGDRVSLYTPPACTKEACNYFAAYSKVFDNKTDAEKAMYAAIDEALAAGKNVAQIRVTTSALYDELMSDDYFRIFQKYAKEKSSSVKHLSRQSSYTAGVQVVHYDIVYN